MATYVDLADSRGLRGWHLAERRDLTESLALVPTRALSCPLVPTRAHSCPVVLAHSCPGRAGTYLAESRGLKTVPSRARSLPTVVLALG